MTAPPEQAEAALQLVLALPGAVIVFDAAGHVVLANAPACDLLGLPGDRALAGMTAGTLVHRLACRGFYGPGDPEALARQVLEADPCQPDRRTPPVPSTSTTSPAFSPPSTTRARQAVRPAVVSVAASAKL